MRTGDSSSSVPSGPTSAHDGSREVDRLFTTVYDELRKVAHRRLATERSGHTLSTTALVHETYLKLSVQQSTQYLNREQFFSIAAKAMRRILVDYARRHRAIKRRQSGGQVSLSAIDRSGGIHASFAANEDAGRADFLLALDVAVDELRAVEERLAKVVEYRFFVGLTEPETAELLGVTPRTIARDWVRARGWLYQRLRDSASSQAAD